VYEPTYTQETSNHKRNHRKMLTSSQLVTLAAALCLSFANAAPQNYNNQTHVRAPQNLIANGDFEYSSCGIGVSSCISSYAPAIAPWIVTSANKKYKLVSHIEPPVAPDTTRNQWALDLNSDAPYTIGQTVATSNGQAYTVKFQIKKNDGCISYDIGTKRGYVQASGGVVRRGNYHQDFPPPPAAPNNPANGAIVFATNDTENWQPITYNFTATSSSTLIEIGSTSSGWCGVEIDHVTMY
jgi:hypothetical protein